MFNSILIHPLGRRWKIIIERSINCNDMQHEETYQCKIHTYIAHWTTTKSVSSHKHLHLLPSYQIYGCTDLHKYIKKNTHKHVHCYTLQKQQSRCFFQQQQHTATTTKKTIEKKKVHTQCKSVENESGREGIQIHLNKYINAIKFYMKQSCIWRWTFDNFSKVAPPCEIYTELSNGLK